jgi:hypothetical protein
MCNEMGKATPCSILDRLQLTPAAESQTQIQYDEPGEKRVRCDES